jgi:uncharacterized protein YjdB
VKKFFSLFLVLFLSLGMIGLVGCNGLWDFDDDDDVSVVPVNFKFAAQIAMGTATNNIRAAALDANDYSANVYYEGDTTTPLNGNTPITDAADGAADGVFNFDFNAYDGRTFYVVFTHNTNANALKLYRYFKKTKAQMDAFTSTTPAVVNETTTAVGLYIANNPTAKYGTDVDETNTNADVNTLVTTIQTYVDPTNNNPDADFTVPVSTVTITQGDSVNVQYGNSVTLTATVLPTFATNKTVTWTMTPADSTLVTLNANTGVVTANTTTEGTVTITATADGKTDTITVNVIQGPVAVTGVTVTPETITIGVNSTTQLTATVAPNNATDKTVTWSASNTKATVSTTGLVTAGAEAGEVTITATTADGSFTDTCVVTIITGSTVTVTPEVTGRAGAELQIHLVGAATTTDVSTTLAVTNGSIAAFSYTKDADATTAAGYPVLVPTIPTINDAFATANAFTTISFSGILPDSTTVKVWSKEEPDGKGGKGAFIAVQQ